MRLTKSSRPPFVQTLRPTAADCRPDAVALARQPRGIAHTLQKVAAQSPRLVEAPPKGRTSRNPPARKNPN
jgi:hypothetical protein